MFRERALKVMLVVVGLVFAVFALVVIKPRQPEVLQMFMGVYATLGVFLLLAARNPAAHRSLIGFAAWSSLVHAGIMVLQSLRDAAERVHLLGGVTLFAVIGVLLLVLAPARGRAAVSA